MMESYLVFELLCHYYSSITVSRQDGSEFKLCGGRLVKNEDAMLGIGWRPSSYHLVKGRFHWVCDAMRTHNDQISPLSPSNSVDWVVCKEPFFLRRQMWVDGSCS